MEKILEKENLRVAAEMMLSQLSEEAHDNAVKHGFYEDYEHRREIEDDLWRFDHNNMILAQLAKVGCEVGEAVDAIQHGDYTGFGHELADVVIRVLDLAKFARVDIGNEVIGKMRLNLLRPYKHGKVC